jgi:hypothetical protein
LLAHPARRLGVRVAEPPGQADQLFEAAGVGSEVVGVTAAVDRFQDLFLRHEPAPDDVADLPFAGVLGRRGWRLHRVWSSSWWMNRDAEVRRLREALATELG